MLNRSIEQQHNWPFSSRTMQPIFQEFADGWIDMDYWSLSCLLSSETKQQNISTVQIV